MNNFKLSARSLGRLVGVNMLLASIMKTAINETTVDFGISEGLRSEERQKMLVETGKSQTLASKHLKGEAVDVLAYVNGSITWDMEPFYEIANAVQRAAQLHSTQIRWGGAWTVPDIREWAGTMKEASASYIETRREQGRKPFIDAPHFELM